MSERAEAIGTAGKPAAEQRKEKGTNRTMAMAAFRAESNTQYGERIGHCNPIDSSECIRTNRIAPPIAPVIERNRPFYSRFSAFFFAAAAALTGALAAGAAAAGLAAGALAVGGFFAAASAAGPAAVCGLAAAALFSPLLTALLFSMSSELTALRSDTFAAAALLSTDFALDAAAAAGAAADGADGAFCSAALAPPCGFA
jgi:hypothetical protein